MINRIGILLIVCTISAVNLLAQSPLENLPYSGAMLVSRAIKTGRLQVASGSLFGGLEPKETCNPAPCVLPNFDIYPTFYPINETPIVTNPANPKQLLAGSNDYSCGPVENQGLNGFNISGDGGTTWTHTCLGLLEGEGTAGDPILGYDLNGAAYIGGVSETHPGGYQFVVSFQKSLDNGKTWTHAKIAAQPLHLGGAVDKPWMQIDTSPTSPYKNSIYVSDTEFSGSGDNDSQIVLTYSYDGGATWTTGYVGKIQTVNVDQNSDIAVGQDGTVYLTWQRCTPAANEVTGTFDCGATTASYYLVKSTDGGKTWTKPSLMFKSRLVFDACGCAFFGNELGAYERIANIPVIAVDGTGKLYVVYYNYTGYVKDGVLHQGQTRIKIATSIDGGTTWTSKRLTPVDVVKPGVDFSLKNQFMPWISVSKAGVIGVTWMDTRNDPYNVNYDEYATFSSDGGETFSKPIRLSVRSSSPWNDGFGGYFIGDYTGNSWVDNKFYVTYTDTSTGVDQDFLTGYIR